MRVAQNLPGDKTEILHIREDKRIVEIYDRVAKNKGSDRSSLMREAHRFYLAANSHLSDQEKKDLGVNGEAKKSGEV
jgi:metal-responsive CopG/Arc/MetJ family transcriptional regulator